MVIQKKQEVKVEEQKAEEKPVLNEVGEKKEIIASDVVVKTTGRVEVIEQRDPQEVRPEDKKPDETMSAADPLTEFKQKMIKEEHAGFDVPVKKNYMWPILFVFIIVILLLVGVFLYKNGIIINNGNSKVNVIEVSPSPVIIPEPTKTLDLTKYEIEILNGGGVAGEASKQKASLEGEGFTVSSVGNADNSDYTDTIIRVKTEVDKDFIAKLKSFLSDSFTVSETESLSEESSVPVVVVIGTKK